MSGELIESIARRTSWTNAATSLKRFSSVRQVVDRRSLSIIRDNIISCHVTHTLDTLFTLPHKNAQSNLGTGRVATLVADPLTAAAHELLTVFDGWRQCNVMCGIVTLLIKATLLLTYLLTYHYLSSKHTPHSPSKMAAWSFSRFCTQSLPHSRQQIDGHYRTARPTDRLPPAMA